MSRRTSVGTSLGSGAGGSWSTPWRMATGLSPDHGHLPVSISWSTTPSAHRSARASTASPRTCSGAM